MKRRIRLSALAATLVLAIATDSPEAQARRSSTPVRYGARTPTGARRGRPRKFSRPSRSVTLTLPEDVIEALQTLDRDVSRAVVRAVQPILASRPPRITELTFGGRSVILVPLDRILKERTGAELVPLPDGRALLSLDEQLSISEFELRVGDALGDPTIKPGDRVLFEELAAILRHARQADGVLREERIIVLRWLRSNQPAVEVRTEQQNV